MAIVLIPASYRLFSICITNSTMKNIYPAIYILFWIGNHNYNENLSLQIISRFPIQNMLVEIQEIICICETQVFYAETLLYYCLLSF